MTKMCLTTGDDTCDLLLQNGLLSQCGPCIADVVQGRCAVVVTDSDCKELFGAPVMTSLQNSGFSAVLIALPAGETSKALPMLTTLYSVFASVELSSVDVVIALGGGVVYDLAGMAAATYLHGVPFVAIPTTIVSQISCSLGGKVTLDLPEGKNLVGLYYQPRLVLIDPAVLSHLPQQGIADGIAEIIQYAAAVDAALFGHLEQQEDLVLQQLISRCLNSKASFLELDRRERGARHVLNYGTTLSYAYERLNGFMNNSYGRSLAAGMAGMARIGVTLGVTPLAVNERLTRLLQLHHLPVAMHFDPKQVHQIALLDKKRYGGTFNLVLLRDIGQPVIYPVSTDRFMTLLNNT